MMDNGTIQRYANSTVGQQTVASRREVRQQRFERKFRTIGGTIISLIVAMIAINLWLGWAIMDGSQRLVISRKDYEQGSLFNSELVAQREDLLSVKNIEKKAAVLGLFRAGKKQIRRP